MTTKSRNIAALVIGIIGTSQLAGSLINHAPLKGLGAALTMAPYPKVFSDAGGLETFASDFWVFTQSPDGGWSETKITPGVYSKVKGSYNRRNVYGAALAYGPKLPEGLRRRLLSFALHNPGNLADEMELQDGRKVVLVKTKTEGRVGEWVLACTRQDEEAFGEFRREGAEP